MRAIHLLLVAAALGALGCAGIKYSTAPGATVAMTEHQFDELAFEMPVGWEAGTVPDGVNLLRCTEREPRACLAVEVNLTDRFASGCEKPEDVMAGLFQGWRERWDVSQSRRVTVAGHQAWRFDDEVTHSLVICRGTRSWVIRTTAFSLPLNRYATAAIDQVVQTARFNPERAPKN